MDRIKSKIPADKVKHSHHDNSAVISLQDKVYFKEHPYLGDVSISGDLNIEFFEHRSYITGDMIVTVSWVESERDGVQFTEDHVVESIEGR